MSVNEQAKRLKSVLRPLGLYKLSGDTLVDFELEAYAEGLKIIDDNLKELEREVFIVTAENYGLSLRESMFGRIKQGLKLAPRREMLIYRGAVTSNDYTRKSIEKALVASGINASVPENMDGGSIYINCISLLDDFATWAQAEQAAKEFVPAHLNVIFDFRVLTWDYIESKNLSFNEMDSRDLNWDAIDNYQGSVEN